MYVADRPVPEPGPRQVRVRVRSCGLNPVDHESAARGVPGWSWPHVPGLDVAGVIESLGPGVTRWQVGDRVAYHGDLRREGGFAEYAIADAMVLARIPDRVSDFAAAALPGPGMSAWQAVVRRLHVSKVDTVLVTGAAGGVGGFAVQLAAATGADVLATAAAPGHERIHALGARAVIDYRTENVATRVRALTDGRGVDAVIDTIGPDSATLALGLVVHGGGVACVGGRADLDVVPPFTTAVSVHEIAPGAAYSHGDELARSRLASDLGELLSLVAGGRLDPMVSWTLTLDEVPATLAHLSRRPVTGKLVTAMD
jgi:NADPH:quinone reductase-like Zn-dependent oxidoreductase